LAIEFPGPWRERGLVNCVQWIAARVRSLYGERKKRRYRSMEIVEAFWRLLQCVQPSLNFVYRDLAHESRPESHVESAQAIFQISDVTLAPLIELLYLEVFL